MCFHVQQSKTAQELKQRFNAHFKDEALFQPAIYNAFQHPKTPLITHKNPNEIQCFHWGLIPSWAKDESIKKNTLNARIETLHEKSSFKQIMHNRCLILADAFYEWKWLDEKGKQKQKYTLTLPNNEAFAFAGLWSEWLNKSTNEKIYTYTILTTAANELMSEIHNSKKRMPIIVATDNEQEWLLGQNLKMQNERLIATLC